MGTEIRFKSEFKKAPPLNIPGPGKYNMIINWQVFYFIKGK